MWTRATDDMLDRSLMQPEPVTALLLLVLCFGCATPPAGGDRTADLRGDVVCRVNGSEIRRRDVEVEKQKLLPAASFHGSVDEAHQQAMRRKALQSLINEELEYQDALARALQVDHKKVAREYAQLVDRYGGKKAFDQRIEQSGIKAKEVKAALERNDLIGQVKEEVVNSAPAVGEKDALEYFAEHADSFQLPRRARVRQFLIYMPPLERDPEDWTRAFDRAHALRARVEAGESFATLASEGSHAPEGERVGGGLIGIVHAGQLEDPLDSVLWTLEAGRVSEPIRGFKGVYLLSVDNFIESRPMEFPEVERRLEKLLGKKRRQQVLSDWHISMREQAQIEIIDPALSPTDSNATETQ